MGSGRMGELLIINHNKREDIMKARVPYYEISNVNRDEDDLGFCLRLFWPVNCEDRGGVRYEGFDHIDIDWTLSYDAEGDTYYGGLIDCSGLNPQFSPTSCRNVKLFFESPLRDLDLNGFGGVGGDSIDDAIERVKRRVDEKIKTIKPMRHLPLPK